MMTFDIHKELQKDDLDGLTYGQKAKELEMRTRDEREAVEEAQREAVMVNRPYIPAYGDPTDTMYHLALDLAPNDVMRGDLRESMNRMDIDELSDVEKQSQLAGTMIDFCHQALQAERKEMNHASVTDYFDKGDK